MRFSLKQARTFTDNAEANFEEQTTFVENSMLQNNLDCNPFLSKQANMPHKFLWRCL
jgi:hypothetical protein